QIKEMNEAQRAAAQELLKTGLSARGYMTATSITQLEKVLQAIEGANRRFPRDPAAYQFSVFGTPGDKKAWGWRFEGHHVSLRFEIVNGDLTSNRPAFFATTTTETTRGW